MPAISRSAITQEALRRRERILGYIRQDPPMPMAAILEVEGMTNRSARTIIKELEEEHGIDYLSQRLRNPREALPFGLTPATLTFRQRLGDQLYLLRERGQNSQAQGRYAVAPQIGMNNREQLRAEQRPFNHDWKLSQIERLARELGRDPRELIMSCLNR
jgi:hypothetical protein